MACRWMHWYLRQLGNSAMVAIFRALSHSVHMTSTIREVAWSARFFRFFLV
jgi:hypothetical protein